LIRVPGWCEPCYEAGEFVPAWQQPSGTLCAFHAAEPAPETAFTQVGADAPADRRSGGAGPRPGGPGGRPGAAARGPGRSGESARTTRRDGGRSARRRARALRYGRQRAAARIDAGRYEPHPGIENFVPPGRLRDQAAALRVVEALVAAQRWRADRREAWLAILRRLVLSMDWETGLVYAVRAEAIGAAGARATRTVSRVVAWAVEVGLVVVAEKAASAAFLGSSKGRTPTYAVYVPPGLPDPTPPTEPAITQLNTVDSELGDLPTVCVGNEPLTGRRPHTPTPASTPWPVFGVPGSPSERSRATHCLLKRLGLDRRGVSGVPLWRSRAQLKRWWDAGASPAGLLYAIDHHPDRPDHHRGDALRGARDPLRVLGYRLKPWDGRIHELPVAVRGILGDYTATARATPHAATPAPATPFTPSSSPALRESLRAELRAELAAIQARRGHPRRRRR
jgi:hypothetical protein